MRSRFLVALTLLSLVVAPGTAAAVDGPPGAVADGSGPGAWTSPTDSSESRARSHGPSRTMAESTERSGSEHDACAPVGIDPQRANPENDTLGWERGCWYDDPIAVTVDDGLNETELAAVVARTMARVEHIRRLEFNETVPVEVITRAEYRERTADSFANTTAAMRLHQNVKYEALFFVDEESDAIAQIRTNRGGSVLGYYSPTSDRIVVISEETETLQLGELTLAHELVHAVQDQQFNISDLNRSTTEADKAILGLVEGDAHYTETLYRERCGDDWDCPSIEQSPPNVPDGFHWGLYFVSYQPYSDGPRFVDTVREDGDWAAVNALYENPPGSSEQVISPEKYPDERPVDVTVADRSSGEWRILDLEDGADYAEFGQVGLSTMFIYPTYEGNPRFVSAGSFRNSGAGSDLDPLNYSNVYSDGWAGDRLYPYVTDDSDATNETGYVWKTVWDSPTDAEEFATGYRALLDYRGAASVQSHEDTYRIPDDEPFGDAFYVNRTGETVVIVNAPTVDDLSAVRSGAAPENTPAPTASPADPGTVAPLPTSTTTPGVGATGALLAILLAGLATRSLRG